MYLLHLGTRVTHLYSMVAVSFTTEMHIFEFSITYQLRYYLHDYNTTRQLRYHYIMC